MLAAGAPRFPNSAKPVTSDDRRGNGRRCSASPCVATRQAQLAAAGGADHRSADPVNVGLGITVGAAWPGPDWHRRRSGARSPRMRRADASIARSAPLDAAAPLPQGSHGLTGPPTRRQGCNLKVTRRSWRIASPTSGRSKRQTESVVCASAGLHPLGGPASATARPTARAGPSVFAGLTNHPTLSVGVGRRP